MKYVKVAIFLVIGIIIGFYIGCNNSRIEYKSHDLATLAFGKSGTIDSQRILTVAEAQENDGASSNRNSKQKLNDERLASYAKMSILAFTEAVKSPENFKAFRAKYIRELSSSQAAFFRNSNLTNEQKKGLLDLLADQLFGKLDVTAVAYDDPASRYHLSREIDATFNAGINMLLDTENANLYRDFTTNTRAWKALDQFISRLDESCPPLNSEQKLQLLDVLRQDGKARSVAELTHTNLPFLSKEQFIYYETYVENEDLIKKATDIEKQLRKSETYLRQELLLNQSKVDLSP